MAYNEDGCGSQWYAALKSACTSPGGRKLAEVWELTCLETYHHINSQHVGASIYTKIMVRYTVNNYQDNGPIY